MSGNRRIGVGMLFALTSCIGAATLHAQQPSASKAPVQPPRAPVEFNPQTVEPPKLEAIGKDRYRIGSIVLDKAKQTFVVPGTVTHLNEGPLEYVAVSKGGYKGYESLIELDSTASEFNLASILAGFEHEGGALPRFQFDQTPVDGPKVDISLQWTAGGKQQQVPLHEALEVVDRDGKASPVGAEWVYIGSYVMPGLPTYAADSVGTVIGFVHDPASIIEHRSGLGIGAYGSVRVVESKLPPIGTRIELVVTRPKPAK